MIVYLARNRVNGKGYVGKTKRSLDQRVKEHHAAAEKGSDLAFHRALRKHGFGSFEWSTLMELSDFTDIGEAEAYLDVREREFIRLFETFGPKGYNLTEGGDGVKGLVHSAETRARMSEARRGEKNHNFGKNWGRQGPHTEETKRKLSEANMGSHHTEEARKKISEALRQRVRKTRSVIQYDMNGNVVATYLSMKLAAEAVSGYKDRVGDCCRGTRESHAGFKWCYAEEQKGTR